MMSMLNSPPKARRLPKRSPEVDVGLINDSAITNTPIPRSNHAVTEYMRRLARSCLGTLAVRAIMSCTSASHCPLHAIPLPRSTRQCGHSPLLHDLQEPTA